MNGKLTLKDGLMVDITEDDVAVVLGFPRGTVEIERKKKKGMAVIGFKQFFMVLIFSMFIERPQNGSVGTHVLYYLDDVQHSSYELVFFCYERVDGDIKKVVEEEVFYVDRIVLFNRHGRIEAHYIPTTVVSAPTVWKLKQLKFSVTPFFSMDGIKTCSNHAFSRKLSSEVEGTTSRTLGSKDSDSRSFLLRRKGEIGTRNKAWKMKQPRQESFDPLTKMRGLEGEDCLLPDLGRFEAGSDNNPEINETGTSLNGNEGLESPLEDRLNKHDNGKSPQAHENFEAHKSS
nr:hypothetical protein Iba_chr10aCG17300 [Ipomoea batatas]GME18116.1 hypothetical protein Iba_scaffold19979CG0030 [Ipomoea batatas]